MNINSNEFKKISPYNLRTTTNNNQDFKDIPSEVVCKIAGYLDCTSYNNLKLTNKFFYVILSDLRNKLTTTENNGRFKDIPSEIFFKITGYLDCLSYNNLKRTNRNFFVVLSDEYYRKSYTNRMTYNLAIRVLKLFSLNLTSCIDSDTFRRPSRTYGLERGLLIEGISFNNEGILTDKHLNEKLLDKLRFVFSINSESFQKLNNFSQEEKNRLLTQIQILTDRCPYLFKHKTKIYSFEIATALKAIPGYQNINDNVMEDRCNNIELLLTNNLRTQSINEIYQLKKGLNHKNSNLDWSTEESFKFSLDNLLLDDFQVYEKVIFSLFVSSRYEPALVSELFKKIVYEMVCYRNENLPKIACNNTDKSIVEIANDCLDTLEYLCTKGLKTIEVEYECLEILLDFKVNRCLPVIEGLKKAFNDSRTPYFRGYENLDNIVKKIIYIDPLALTPDMLNEIYRELEHTTISLIKDRLLDIGRLNPPNPIKQKIIFLIKQLFIIGTSYIPAIPTLIDLKNNSNFETKINNVCQILNNAPCYSNEFLSHHHSILIKKTGDTVLNQLLPSKTNTNQQEIKFQIEKINNSNLYPLMAKCFPINLSKFFSHKQRIKQYKFNLLDPKKMQDIIKELTNQIGKNQTTIKFLTANNISLHQDENLYMDAKSLCRFFRNPALFPTLSIDFESILKYFKIVMDSNCPKKVNIPIIIDFLKNMNFLDVEKVDVIVKTMIESLNYQAHKYFKSFALSLNCGSEKVLSYYDFLFDLHPDLIINIKYKAQKAILLENFMFNDIIDNENHQRVLTKLNNSQKRKLEGVSAPSSKRKK